MTGDAYEILGVPPSADDEAIKRAFRALARKHHPDLSDDEDADERFKAARRAYEELIDAAARERLDRRRLAAAQAAALRREAARARAALERARAGDPHELGGLFDLLAQAVQSFGPGGSPYFRDRLSPGEHRFEGRLTGSRRVELDAILTPEEARDGIEIPFRFQLGARLISENVLVPPGVSRGDRLAYAIPVVDGIQLDLVVHVDIG